MNLYHREHEQYHHHLSKPEVRDYTRFYTPDEIADYMVYWAAPNRRYMSYLEPHAGGGSIIRAIRRIYDTHPRSVIWAVELESIDSNFLEYQFIIDPLFESGADMVIRGDFLTAQLVPRFDRIIANPPFGNSIDLQAHFDKMLSLLLPGGKLVTILPKDFVIEIPHYMEPLENWATNKDGSKTEIKLVVIDKI